MAIKPKPKKAKPVVLTENKIESAPNKSMKKGSPGKPSFKSGIDCVWKKRLVEIPEDFIRECGIKKVNGEIDGLDHAIFLALKKYLDK